MLYTFELKFKTDARLVFKTYAIVFQPYIKSYLRYRIESDTVVKIFSAPLIPYFFRLQRKLHAISFHISLLNRILRFPQYILRHRGIFYAISFNTRVFYLFFYFFGLKYVLYVIAISAFNNPHIVFFIFLCTDIIIYPIFFPYSIPQLLLTDFRFHVMFDAVSGYI